MVTSRSVRFTAQGRQGRFAGRGRQWAGMGSLAMRGLRVRCPCGVRA